MGKFDKEQLKQIELGFKSGVDVSKYSNPEFDGDKMRLIRRGLERGLDPSPYISPKFDYWQIYQVIDALDENEPIGFWADVKYTPDQMLVLRDAVRNNIDCTELNLEKYDYEGMEAIIFSIKHGIDYSSYASGYTGAEMKVIAFGLYLGVDVKLYLKMGFDADQCGIFLQAIRDNLDVDKFVNLKYSYKQMLDLMMLLSAGIDGNWYVDRGFNYQQAQFIDRIKEPGEDISPWAKPEYSVFKMGEFREQLEYLDEPINYFDYGFDERVLEAIKHALKDGINLINYALDGYDSNGLYAIHYAIAHNLDYRKVLNKKFNYHQRKQILKGLESGVNVDVYAKPELFWSQMQELRRAMERGVDVRHLAKPEYSGIQLIRIIWGLENNVDMEYYVKNGYNDQQISIILRGYIFNVDVSQYDSLDLNHKDMEAVFLELYNRK